MVGRKRKNWDGRGMVAMKGEWRLRDAGRKEVK